MQRRTARPLALLTVAAVLAAACSGGGGDDTGDTGDTADDGTTGTTAADEADAAPTAVDVEVLEASTPEVTAPDADLRCERMGYPCSWSDIEPAEFDATADLASEITAIVDGEPDPIAGLDAAVARLAEEPDLVELIVDREAFTGLMYRLDGQPPSYALTSLAAPLGELGDAQLATPPPASPDDTDTGDTDTGDTGADEPTPNDTATSEPATSAAGEPQGFRTVQLHPEAYRPAGGPKNPKTALVLDPYEDRVEATVVSNIMGAHPQISVDYAAGVDVDPLGFSLGGYDLVHVASHGSSGCANESEGWTGSIRVGPDPDADDAPISDFFGSTTWDENRCYSVLGLGSFDQDTYNARGRPRVPPGIGMNGSQWLATTDYFVSQAKSDAIVYLSNCTSADGVGANAAGGGSFVGWHSYARVSVAAEAATEFWRLMVTEGVEFDVASEWLDSEGLDWSFTAQADWRGLIPDQVAVGATYARLATTGKNQRARDVIAGKLDGNDWDGQVVDVNGKPGDSDIERFPTGEQELTFELEGVRSGSEGGVTIEIYKDGDKLKSDIDLSRDGSVIESGDEWDTWRVTVKQDAIEFGRTTAADFAPGATFELEARAYEQQSEYTADVGTVRLNTKLAAAGPLPIFEQLKTGVEAEGGYVEGNELVMKFETKGGSVEGDLRVTTGTMGIEIGFWQMDLEGDYNPETGTMSGTVDVESRGSIGPITAGDSGSGQWQASVNLDAGTVTGTIGLGGQSQPYTGQIRDAG